MLSFECKDFCLFQADHHPAAQSESGGSLGGLENSGLAMVWNLGFNADTPDAIYQCQVRNGTFSDIRSFFQAVIIPTFFQNDPTCVATYNFINSFNGELFELLLAFSWSIAAVSLSTAII